MAHDCADQADGEATTSWDLAARAHMIRLTAAQEIKPYRWVHPDEER
jgi:hypothetical protein